MAIKRGQTVRVSSKAMYNGTDMDWTETFTGIKTIGKGGEWVVHTSRDFISEFLSKKICVTPSLHTDTYFESNATKKNVTSEYYITKYVYSIFLPEGTEVETYSDNEYRFDLSDDFKVVFSGQIHRRSGGFKLDNMNKQIYFDLFYSNAVKN